MRFLIILLSVSSSVSFAGVNNFNQLISETSQQERRLHKKLLHAIQNTQYAIAHNDQMEKIQYRAQKSDVLPEVQLVPTAELAPSRTEKL